jgi:hypothetical protein
MGRACSINEKNTYRILMGKPEGKRQLGRTRCRWVDYTKMDLGEIGRGGMDWIDLGPVEGSCEHGNKPSDFVKCWEVHEWLHSWRPLEKGSAPWS